jgi:S1-C subfamily serine protease
MCRVTLADQSTYDAKVVGFDQDKDVAVLRVDAPKEKLRPIPVGVSADLLVGQKVYAIGNPVRFSYRFDAYCIVNVYSFMNFSICRVDGSPDLI